MRGIHNKFNPSIRHAEAWLLCYIARKLTRYALRNLHVMLPTASEHQKNARLLKQEFYFYECLMGIVRRSSFSFLLVDSCCFIISTSYKLSREVLASIFLSVPTFNCGKKMLRIKSHLFSQHINCAASFVSRFYPWSVAHSPLPPPKSCFSLPSPPQFSLTFRLSLIFRSLLSRRDFSVLTFPRKNTKNFHYTIDLHS